MRIAIVGTNGTLGTALARAATAAGHQVWALNRPQNDITEQGSIAEGIAQSAADVLIHPAAYTDVDGCELNPEQAYGVNAIGTRNVALACAATNIPMLYISTNCVFDGAASKPYLEWDQRNPISVYGASKLAGEKYVEHLLTKFYIVRISWLFGHEGNHFVHKIIKAADQRGSLSVVADEIATPTYAEDLSQALLELVARPSYGWYHLVNEGECSRFDYAKKIMELTGRADVPMTPTELKDFKRPSSPPPHSTLRNMVGAQQGIALRSWEEALEAYISETPELMREPSKA